MAIFDSHNYRVVREERPTTVAQVFEATHPDRKGRLLVEVLSAGVSSAPALEAFERDIAAVSLLGHPCVLEVLDLGALADGTPVVISEYPEGVTLPRWLERERLAPDADALEVIAGLAEALTAAHDCGISHGALRPDQVYLVKDGHGGLGLPKLRGFGQRWLSPGARSPSPAGLLGAAGLSGDDIAEDVRALAVIAELLLTPPELRGAADGLAFGTAPAASEVIRTASAGGDDGFASPREFAAALASAVRCESPSGMRALVPGAVQALARWPQAPRLAIGLAAGVSLSVVIAVGAGMVSEVAAPLAAHGVPAGRAPVAVAPRPPAAPAPIPVTSLMKAPVMARAAIEPVALAREPIEVAAVAPAEMEPTPARKPVVLNARRPPPSPLRGVVWSDRQRRLVSVDENGTPITTPTDPPAFEPQQTAP